MTSRGVGQPAAGGSSPKFERVFRKGATAEAVAEIQDMIRNRSLKAGDRLPTERELAEALGLSRPTVREAVQALAAMNILDVRHGTGIFVGSLDLTTLLAPLWFALELTEPAFEQLFEIRVALEPLAAGLATERATDEEVAQIQEAMASMNEVGLAREYRVIADIELHKRIVEASHNDLLIGVIASLTVLAKKSRELTVELPNRESNAVSEHLAIVDAIVRRDPEAAMRGMQVHLSNAHAMPPTYRERLFSQINQPAQTTRGDDPGSRG